MTYSNKEDLNKAAHAVDKDLSTHAASELENGEVWLKLEFRRTYLIHTITIYYIFYTNRYDPAHWCVQSAGNYQFCMYSQNNVDIAVYLGDKKQGDCGTLQLTKDGTEQADQIYIFQCSATKGDTVLLSKNTNGIFVSEVVVTGEFLPGKYTHS